MNNYIKTDVLIIGAGILGCMAARQLAKYDLSITVLEKNCDVGRGITRANTAIIYPGYDQHPGSLKAEMTVKANRTFEQLCRELDVPYKKCGSLMIGFGPNAERTLQKKFRQGLENGVEGIRLLNHNEIMKLEPGIVLGKINSAVDFQTEDSLMYSDNMKTGTDKPIMKPTAALYSETAGTVNPWQLCIAAYENARDNGVKFVFNSEVTGITRNKPDYNMTDKTSEEIRNGSLQEEKNEEHNFIFSSRNNSKFIVTTDNGIYKSSAVLITAGLNAAKVWEMAEKPRVRIKPMAADYLILDTNTEGIVNHIIQIEPEEKGEGLTMVPTVDGNMLIGPTRREYIPVFNGNKPLKKYGENEEKSEINKLRTADRKKNSGSSISGAGKNDRKENDTAFLSYDTDFPTEYEGIKSLERKMHELVPQFSWNDVIRYFGTLRPNPYYVVETENGYETSGKSINDFEILEKDGLFNLIGVKTPGITCSNELGKYISMRIVSYLDENNDFCRNKEMLKSQSHYDPNSSAFDKRQGENLVYNRIKLKAGYNPYRKKITAFRDLNPEEAGKIIKEVPLYGNIVCKCCNVSEAEIVESVKRGAMDLEGVKRRVNTGMGRCQGSGCDEEIARIIARETGRKLHEIL